MKLTDAQINDCALVGRRIRQTSVARNHRNKPGYNVEAAEKNQMLSTVAEGAACVALGVEIEIRENVFRVADVLDSVQVRLIGADNFGMRVYDNDPDEWCVFGVIIPRGCERKPYRLPGWYLAGDAKDHPEWIIAPNGGPPVIAVPQKFLRPNSELRELLRADGHPVHDRGLLR